MRTLLIVLVVAVVGVGALLFVLDTAPGRARACRALTELVGGAVKGSLRIGRCTELRPSRLRVERVELLDPAGRTVVAARRISVRPDVWALLRGELHVLDVEVRGLTVHLTSRGGELDLRAALAPRAPATAAAFEPPAFVVDRLRVSGGRVDGLPRGLTVERIAVELGVGFARHLSIGVRSVSADLARAGVEVARLRDTRAVVRFEPGARSELAATLASGTDHLELRARTAFGDDGPGPFEARASFTASPALLARLGQPPSEPILAAPVAGIVEVTGVLADLGARGQLDTAGGSIGFEGRARGERLEAHGWSSGLALGRVLASVERGHVAGDVHVQLGPAAAGTGVRALEVAVRDGRIDEVVVPDLRARGSLGADEVLLSSLAVPHLTGADGRLDVEGRFGFDGSVALRLDAVVPDVAADANVRRLAPGAGGGLEARLRASRMARGRIEVDGRVSLNAARLPGVRVRRLDVEGRVRGALAAPEVSLRIGGRELQVAGQTVRDLALTLVGGPVHYRLAGGANLARRGTLRVDLDVLARSGTYQADGTATATGWWASPLAARVRELRIDPARAVEIGELRVTAGPLRIAAQGALRFAGSSSIEVEVGGLDLAEVDRVLALRRGLSGTAALTLRLRGTLREPDLVVSARVTDGRVAGVPVSEARLEAHLDAARGTLSATTQLRLASFGRVDARLRGTFATRGRLFDRLHAGTWEAALEGHDLPPRLACRIDPRAPVLDGAVEVRLLGTGTLAAPQLRLEVSARGLAATGLAPLDVDAAVDVAPDRVSVTAAAADEHGRLGSLRFRSSVTLSQLLELRAPLALLARPWELQVELPERRLDTLPAPLRVAVPVRLRGGVVLRGGAGPLEADAHLVAVTDPLAVETDPACRRGRPPELGVDLTLRDGQTRVGARALLQRTAVLTAELRAVTPVDAWLRDGLPAVLPAVQAIVRASSLPLGALPVVCARASGTLDLTLEGVDLFTDTASLHVQGTVHGLRVGDAPASELELGATVTGALATLQASLEMQGRRALAVEARAPIDWSGEGLLPTIRDEPWQATLRADHAPLGPLLVAVPQLEQPSGSLHGALTVRGTGTRWAADGSLALEHVSFIVADPLLRVDDLRGRIRLSPAAIAFEDLSLRDGDGRLRASGRLAFEDGAPRSVDLALRATDYPVRVDGVVFAYVDTVTTIDARLSEARNTVRVSLRQLSVQLPDLSGRSVQGLDQHPDVLYEDQPGFAGASARTGPIVPAPVEEAGTPLHVVVDASRLFWVRRNDLSVQLTADLQIDRAGAVTQISGPIRIRRGFLQLAGKSFAFERGEIRFDGGRTVNPLLQLRAVHTLASRETVTVTIGGRLLHPELAFSTTVPGVVTELEILQLLVRGRGGPQMDTVRDQAVSAVSGLTAGFISSITRRELGEYLPILGIESSTGGGTRIHAGLEADRVIPRGLRGLVQGAYVEGMLGTGQTSDTPEGRGGGGSRGGFLIELCLPHDLVTSGTFAEPNNWSIDLSWEP